VIVVGFCSSYCEGRLVRGAIESLLEVGLDRLYVFEGPAGEPLENEDELPASELELGDYREPFGGLVVHRGRWRTDGRKRNEWLQRVHADYGRDEPVWAVVVDADEVLVNGRYLRDRLEWILARDALNGASVTDKDNPPMARWPLHLVEHEGSMSMITGRVFRADLLRSIDHSSSVVTNVAGVQDGWGNFAATSRAWLERWLAATDAGALLAWPPLPTEPFIAHRTNLRHPLRAQLRMSDQELVEFAKAQGKELH